MTVGGNVNVLANTDSVANANALASQVGTLVGGLTVDEETQRQIKRLAVIAGVDDILFPFIDPHPVLQGIFNAQTDVDAAADTIKIATLNEFDTGDAVVYHNNEDDTSVGVLIDGHLIGVDAVNPALVKLYATRADALASTNALDLRRWPILRTTIRWWRRARSIPAAAVNSTAEPSTSAISPDSDGDSGEVLQRRRD